MENRMDAPYKLKPPQSCNPTSGHIQRNWYMKRHVHPNVHRCTVYNSQAKFTIYNSQDNEVQSKRTCLSQGRKYHHTAYTWHLRKQKIQMNFSRNRNRPTDIKESGRDELRRLGLTYTHDRIQMMTDNGSLNSTRNYPQYFVVFYREKQIWKRIYMYA